MQLFWENDILKKKKRTILGLKEQTFTIEKEAEKRNKHIWKKEETERQSNGISRSVHLRYIEILRLATVFTAGIINNFFVYIGICYITISCYFCVTIWTHVPIFCSIKYFHSTTTEVMCALKSQRNLAWALLMNKHYTKWVLLHHLYTSIVFYGNVYLITFLKLLTYNRFQIWKYSHMQNV